MNHTRLGLYILGGLALLALALATFGPLPFREAQRSMGVAPPPGAFFSDPAAGLTAKGLVESENVIELGSQVKGVIAKLPVEEGNLVEKGQLLVRLESNKVEARITQAEAELRAAQAKLREVESGPRHEDLAAARAALAGASAANKEASEEYERQVRLLVKGATTVVERNRAQEAMRVTEAGRDEARAHWEKLSNGSRPEDLEQARARQESARAALAYERTLLADYTLVAPFGGLVAQTYRDRDETVDVGTPLLKLIDPARLRVVVEVEESDLGRVAPGQKVAVATESSGGHIYHGTVTRVFSTVEKKRQRTFDPMASFDINTQKIYVTLDDYAGLVHGLTVNVRFSP